MGSEEISPTIYFDIPHGTLCSCSGSSFGGDSLVIFITIKGCAGWMTGWIDGVADSHQSLKSQIDQTDGWAHMVDGG